MTTNNSDLKKLFLELTMKCNLNCKTCFRHKWDIPLVDMSKEMACEICKDLEVFPEVNEIVFGGIGEPTLHPDFSRIVPLFGKYSIGLTSNAYNWSEETLDTIVQLVLSTSNAEEVYDLIPKLHRMGVMKLIISNLLPQDSESREQILYAINRNEFMREKRNQWLQTCLAKQIRFKKQF